MIILIVILRALLIFGLKNYFIYQYIQKNLLIKK
uniref:Uncharacterized protein n=1 Tax=Physcomitrium patens TaxID=3218 RepID=A0A7I3ZZU9_PHYPA